MLAHIAPLGWQHISLTGDYGLRARTETAMSRWKHLIGPKLLARTLSGQQGHAALAVSVLNHMLRAALCTSAPPQAKLIDGRAA